MSGSEHRRLAAIVSADVVGYSRLMGADERGTLRALKAHIAELIEPAVASHGGRIVKTTGDGLLLEFASVVAAVDCCLAVQDGMARRNADVANNTAIRFRIGVHLGDVIVDDDDIFGDGVNIAARLQELGVPGGVAVSDIVHDYLDASMASGFTDLGERELKNIRRPVRVWQRGSQPTTAPAPRRVERPSIAVLPFDNMSGESEQEYFSDGITEDIITALSRLRWLTVISRQSTFTYKGRAAATPEIGAALGARYLVAGSVRRSGDRLRVTAQLTDGRSGNQVWAQRYDRQLVDIFDLQDELAEAISANLDVEVASHEREQAHRKATVDLDAWDCLQRGMWHLYKMTKDELAAARALFERAVTQDAGYARAHAALGYAAAIEALSGHCADRDATLRDGLRSAEHAVELDERDAFNHFALGRVCTVRGLHDRALLALERSVALNPSSAQAAYGLGVAYFWTGNAAQALPHLERAIRLSPQDPHLWSFHYIRGNALYLTERIDEARAAQQAAIQHKGNEYLPYLTLAAVLSRDPARQAAARDALAQAGNLKPDLTAAFLRASIGNLHPSYMETFIADLTRLGLPR